MNEGRVLIVEDEYPIREHIKSMLNDTGYILVEAGSGEEALIILQSQTFDIMVTDIRMPKMDGIALIRQCIVQYPQMWSIVLSNYAEFELAQQAMRYGAKQYLLKATLTMDELQAEIKKMMQVKANANQNVPLDQNERITIMNALFNDRLHNNLSTPELIRRVAKHKLPFFTESFNSLSIDFWLGYKVKIIRNIDEIHLESEIYEYKKEIQVTQDRFSGSKEIEKVYVDHGNYICIEYAIHNYGYWKEITVEEMADVRLQQYYSMATQIISNYAEDEIEYIVSEKL